MRYRLQTSVTWGQGIAAEEPTGHMYPGEQEMQAAEDTAPEDELYVPSVQFVGNVEPTPHHAPCGQLRQLEELPLPPEGLYVPAKQWDTNNQLMCTHRQHAHVHLQGHCPGVLQPNGQIWPVGQLKQAADPLFGWYVPTAHGIWAEELSGQ